MSRLIKFARLSLAAVGLGVAGCSTVDDTLQRVLAARTTAMAVVGGRVLLGQASYTQPRAGTVDLHSPEAPAYDCTGSLTLTATMGGVASLVCSDGQSVAIPFQLLGAMRAAGRVTAGESVAALTYGLSPDLAAPYLGMPVERLR